MAVLIAPWRDNILLQSGATLTPSTEHADHLAANLKIASPQEFWRATALPATLTYTPAIPTTYNVVAMLYTRATPHRNLVRYSEDMTQWTRTGMLQNPIETDGVFSATTIPQWVLEVDTSTGLHQVDVTTTKWGSSPAVRFSFYALRQLGGANVRLYLEGASASHNAEVKWNLGTGAVQSSSVAGSFSGLTASAGVAVGSGYRLQVTVTLDAATTLKAALGVLDASFASSFTGSGEIVFVGGVLMQAGDAAAPALIDWVPSGAATGAGWVTSQVVASNTIIPVAMQPNLRDFATEFGYIHAWDYPSTSKTVSATATYTLTVYDPHNADSRFDLSNLWIGKAFTPASDYEGPSLKVVYDEDTEPIGRQTPAGRAFRRFELMLPMLTEDEARREMLRILSRVGKSGYLLVILDPTDRTYGQSGIVYGQLDRPPEIAWRSARTDGGPYYSLTLSIREATP